MHRRVILIVVIVSLVIAVGAIFLQMRKTTAPRWSGDHHDYLSTPQKPEDEVIQ